MTDTVCSHGVSTARLHESDAAGSVDLSGANLKHLTIPYVPEMAERVAKSIAVAAFVTHNRRDGTLKRYITPQAYADDRWQIYRDDARAAIAAMREPTDAMLDAAIAPYRHGNTDEFNEILRKTVTKYLNDMIDEALK